MREIPCINCVTLPMCRNRIEIIFRKCVSINLSSYEMALDKSLTVEEAIKKMRPYYHDVQATVQTHAKRKCSILQNVIDKLSDYKKDRNGNPQIEDIKYFMTFMADTFNFLTDGKYLIRVLLNE